MAGGVVTVGLLSFLAWFMREAITGEPFPELTQAELDSRNGLLYLKGSEEVFTGILVEDYATNVRKLSIPVLNGRAHGLSHGWYENGQMEVEENFRHGLSNGLRTRWYANGTKKSQATIEDGLIVGTFIRWHENGVKAAAVEMENGQAHGLAQAWYPSGALKSKVPYDHGEPGEALVFPDENPVARTEPAN